MTENDTLTDAVRTVGQLLLHRPTTGYLAKDANGNQVEPENTDATCFCIVGACLLAGSHFGFDRNDFYVVSGERAYANRLSQECDKTLGKVVDGSVWDEATPKQRKAWATKLANFKG